MRRQVENKPLSLEEARRTMGQPVVNSRSRRAAVCVRAPSSMGAQGEVIKRVRLIRPLGSETMTRAHFEASRWEVEQGKTFDTLWNAEVAQTPKFTVSELCMVTGLLLPIWNRLPSDNMRVYRAQCDNGERILGRLTTPEAAAAFAGVDLELSAEDLWGALLDRGARAELAGGLSLQGRKVMYETRIEVAGFAPEALPQLKALGLMTEIVQHQTRLFVPMGEGGRDVLAALLKRYPLMRCAARL